MPCLRQALYSSTAPFITPWSVSPSAGCSNAAARSASASILHAPSSSEYSEWTWRCAQAGVLTESSRREVPDRTLRGRRARPRRTLRQFSAHAACARSSHDFSSATSSRSPRTIGRWPGGVGSAPEEVREALGGHRHGRVRAVLRRGGEDLDAAAIADGDVPRGGRVALDGLGDREAVVARPGGVDHVGERAVDELGLEPARRRGRRPRALGVPAGMRLERLHAALAAAHPRRAEEAPDAVLARPPAARRGSADRRSGGTRRRAGRGAARAAFDVRAAAGDRDRVRPDVRDREVVVRAGPVDDRRPGRAAARR